MMVENTWKEYFEKTKDSKPRPLLVKALNYVESKDEALDLGAGALNDVRYIISEGFKHITAVDSTPMAEEIIKNFPSNILFYIVSKFEDFNFTENTYDIVSAQYALPFNPKDTFNKVFESIISSLKPNGIFTAQLFGIKDTWNVENSNMTFHTREEAEKLLSSLTMLEFTEEENDRPTVSGDQKHWHIFHFIVRKK